MRVLSLVLLGAGAAFFHTHLTGSVPATNAVVRSAPAEIRLTFSGRPELPLTSVKLFRADSSAVALPHVAKGPDTLTVAAKVPAGLTPGLYVVVWRTASRDGHVVRGSYRFTYSTTAPAPALPAAPAPHAHK